MHQSELFFQDLFEATPHPYLIVQADESYTIVAVNDHYINATGIVRENVIGKSLFEVFPDNPRDTSVSGVSDLHISLDSVVRYAKTDIMGVQKYDIPLRDGSDGFETKYWSPVNAPIFDEHGNVTYIIHNVEDVTDFVLLKEANTLPQSSGMQTNRLEAEVLKRANEVKEANRLIKAREKELAELNDKLKELDRLKTEFFSNISHEFRTPLTLMLAPTEELLANRQNLKDERITSNLEIIHRNTLRLLKLVNNLLDFSRIEAGRAKASYEATDISSLTADLASNFSSASELADVQLIVDCPPMREWVDIDREMWEKIVLNLLSNAFKFTHKGSITISTHLENEKAVLRVQDTGIGIPEEALPQLFERFYRVGNVYGRSYEGTGIGLSLVKELVKLQGGTIDVESKLGEGTSFTITMPLNQHKTVENSLTQKNISSNTNTKTYIAEAARWSNSTKKDTISLMTDATKGYIVVADDNADMREFIGRLLHNAGYTVTLAIDGVDAWEICQQKLPDLIISDVMMPRMNGFDLLKKIRSAEYTYTLPIILLSARAGDSDKAQGLTFGADDYLAKPFHSGELIARVDGAVKLGKYRKQAHEQLLAQTNHIAKVGGWSFDVATMAEEWTDELFRIHDLPLNEPIKINRGLDFYTPESRPIIQKALEEAIALGKPYDLELEIITAIGTHKWIRTVGSPIMVDGKVIKVQGAMQDITKHKMDQIELAHYTALLNTILNSSPDAIFVKDLEGKYILFNEGASKLVGIARDKVIGHTDEILFTPEAATLIQEIDRKVLANGVITDHEEVVTTVFGEEKVFWATKGPMKTEGEKVFGLFGISRDITERKQTEIKLLKYKTIFENIAEGVYSVDLFGKCTYINQAALYLLRFNEDEILGYNPHYIFHYKHEDGSPYAINECPINNAVMSGITKRLEENFIHKDGSTFPVYVTVAPIIQEGLLIGSVITFEDITQQKEDQHKILIEKERFDHLAHYDELTELPNRLSLNEFMEIRFSENAKLAFMFLDLDGFKEINDSYGHGFGDKLLIDVSVLLKEIFPQNSYIVRTGGDEFVIVLPYQEDKNLIDTMMEKISGMFNNPFSIDEKDIYVTASIGIAMYPDDAQSTEELLKCADAAMYNAKNLGKNTFSFYNSALTDQVLYRMMITTNLKKAISNHELVLYFQPQVDPKSGAIVGSEALLRWFSPQGNISPSDFIPIAEESGLILEIGEFVLKESFKIAKRWSDKKILKGRIAVNVAASQFIHTNFIALLEQISKDTHCRPEWIELEITERSILLNPEKVSLILEELRAKGFHVSIDDFGTGYSSLSYLKNLPIDKLKIDISFIRNITNEPKNQTIVKTIIALARGLEIEVVAEGVESIEEMEFLRNNGVDSIQGYYYFKPASTNAMDELFNTLESTSNIP